MNIKQNAKPLLVAGLVLAGIAGTTTLAATAVNAQSNGDTLVEKIASKFNLNKSDVQAVFDEAHDEHEAEKQAEFSDDLQDKVDSGDITAEQKTLIENKFKELQGQRDSNRQALEDWAEQNNIDAKYLHMGHGRGGSDLQDAVDDGDLTSEQKTLIENKQKELEDKRSAERDELEKWASDNNLDLKDIMPMGRGHGRKMGGGPRD